ncbi:hypothetical protein RFI_11777, partial [Reticulomyxa filosa]
MYEQGSVAMYVINLFRGSGVLAMEWLLIRIWLLYYDFTYDIHQLDFRWQKHISVNYVPWTMKYTFLGNLKVLFGLSVFVFVIIESTIVLTYVNMCVCVCVCDIIRGLVSWFGKWTWMYVSLASGIVLSIAGVYPVQKIQQVRDVMDVKDEIFVDLCGQGEIRWLLLSLLTVLIMLGVGALVLEYQWKPFPNALELWICWSSSVIVACVSYVSLHRVSRFVDEYERSRLLTKMKHQ